MITRSYNSGSSLAQDFDAKVLEMHRILGHTRLGRLIGPRDFVKKLEMMERSNPSCGDFITLMTIYEAGRINGIREERKRRATKKTTL